MREDFILVWGPKWDLVPTYYHYRCSHKSRAQRTWSSSPRLTTNIHQSQHEPHRYHQVVPLKTRLLRSSTYEDNTTALNHLAPSPLLDSTTVISNHASYHQSQGPRVYATIQTRDGDPREASQGAFQPEVRQKGRAWKQLDMGNPV